MEMRNDFTKNAEPSELFIWRESKENQIMATAPPPMDAGIVLQGNPLSTLDSREIHFLMLLRLSGLLGLPVDIVWIDPLCFVRISGILRQLAEYSSFGRYPSLAFSFGEVNQITFNNGST